MSDAVLVSHSTSQSGSIERAHRAPSATSASELDLLCLIHDISVLQKESPSTYSKCVQNVRQRFSDIPKNTDLIHFIIKHPDLYIHKEIRRLPYPASCYAINWLSIFYNPRFESTAQRLFAISPLLSSFAKWKMDHCFHFIREQIPFSAQYPSDGLNVECLFGEFESINISHLSTDLCSEIVSYLDLITFFKLSRINHSYLHLIYRTDAFHGIWRHFVRDNALQCILSDTPLHYHSRFGTRMSDQVRLHWQFRSTLKHWDYITLQEEWIQRFVDIKSIRLELQSVNEMNPNERNESTSSTSTTSWTVHDIRADSFDGFNVKHIFTEDDAEEKDMENDESDGAYYRLKITMIFPPNPWTIYSEAIFLNRKGRQLNDGNNTTSFAFMDNLYSLRDYDVIQQLEALLLDAQRRRYEDGVLEKFLAPEVMRQIVRLLLHRNRNIQSNASNLLSYLFGTLTMTSKDLRERYLELAVFGTDYNVIDIALETVIKMMSAPRDRFGTDDLKACHHMMNMIMNIVVSKVQDTKDDNVKWKKLVITHRCDFVSFMIDFVGKEQARVADEFAAKTPVQKTQGEWWFRAMAIRTLSSFFRYRSDDDDEEITQILTDHVTQQSLRLLVEWTITIGKGHLQCAKKMNSKSAVNLFQKEDNSQPRWAQIRRYLNNVISACCVGINYVFWIWYNSMESVLDQNICRLIASQTLEICVRKMDEDWAQYLMHLSLKIMGLSLRLSMSTQLMEDYVELKVVKRLNAILQRIKKELPNEQGFVSSVKKWVRNKTSSGLSSRALMGALGGDDQKLDSLIELFDDVVDVVNAVPSSRAFGKLVEDILDVAVVYGQRAQCDEKFLQHTLSMSWNMMVHRPKEMRKVITKHKGFMKSVKKWNGERGRHDVVFEHIVFNVHSVTTDSRLFEEIFFENQDDDEKERVEKEYKCACGLVLEQKKADDCYEHSTWLYCDLCYSKMGGDVIVFHCDQGPQHPNGFDLCAGCARKETLIKRSAVSLKVPK